MKWNTNGIKFARGNYESLIAQYNGSGAWFVMRGLATQQTQKSAFKRFGEFLGAQSCEVKPYYDENDHETESDVAVFMALSDGSYRFYIETEERLEPIELSTIEQYFRLAKRG